MNGRPQHSPAETVARSAWKGFKAGVFYWGATIIAPPAMVVSLPTAAGAGIAGGAAFGLAKITKKYGAADLCHRVEDTLSYCADRLAAPLQGLSAGNQVA